MNVVNGENSDLVVRGVRFHVQTEDWGFDARVFVSRIFKDGSVVKTYKISYEKVPKVTDPDVRRKAVLRLHQIVVEKAQSELNK
jgi:hypothetical protein